MRKNRKFYLGVLLVSVFLGISNPAHSMLTYGLSSDGPGAMAGMIASVTEQLQTVADNAVKFVKEKVTAVKASLPSYFSKRKNTTEKVPGTKNFAENSSVDIYDAVAVQAAFNELFLQYPTSDPRANKFYEKEAVEFYYDTMIEIQTATKKLEAQLNSLRTDIDTFSKEAINPSSNGGNAMSSKDESGIYYNMYLVHKKFNDVLKITEEVMALYSQYYVARAVYLKKVNPAPYQKPEDKKSDEKKSTAIRIFHDTVAFAQFVNNSAVAADTEEEPVEETAPRVNVITFVEPEAPEAKSLMAGSEKELADLGVISQGQRVLSEAIDAHNMMQQLPEYRNLFLQYDLFVQLHEKAAQVVAISDQCVVQYIGRHYKQPEIVWYGNTAAQKTPIDYDKRTGISGWAISAFQVANADKSGGIDIDSFATIDYEVDTENRDLNKVSDIEKQVASTAENATLSSPSKQLEFSNTVREIELITWQIGAQAAMILAEDQHSATPVYGQAYKPYPLWQDQKSFYNQYIDAKYENIKTYIRNMDLNSIALQISEVMNDEQVDEELKASTQQDLGKLSSYISKQQGSESATSKEVSAKKAALKKNDAEREAALVPYQSSKNSLLKKLDDFAAQIVGINEEITVAEEEISIGTSKVAAAKNNIINMNKRGVVDDSTIYEMSRNDLSSGSLQVTKNTNRLAELRSESKKIEKQRDAINAKISGIDTKVSEIEESFVVRRSALEAEHDAKIAAASASKKGPNLAGIASQLRLSGFSLFSTVSNADKLVSDAKTYAIQMVDKAKKDMYNLGDDLYEVRNNRAVVNRHKELISSLKSLPQKQFARSAMSFVSGDSVSAITSLLSSSMSSVVTSTICSNTSCNEGDSEYFVGITAKARDFAAPKAPDFKRYPSPRDVVHFDVTDYKNIKKTGDGIVTRSSILNYGGQIPEIWTKLLAEDAFVERGVNLGSMLEQGGENKYFMRGINYPCRLGDYAIDIAASKIDLSQTSGQYLVSKNLNRKLPACQGIKVNGVLELYMTIYDVELDKSARAGTQATPIAVSPSELGTLFEHSDQRLRFNSAAYNVYQRMLDIEEKAMVENVEYEVRDNVYEKAMYAENQIGNFLHFVDRETGIRKNIEEMKLSIDQIRKDIKESLAKMGFKVSDNFNLANKDDYNYIQSKLNEYKNNRIGQAASDISSVNHSNPVVKERYEKVENMRKALVKDKDALISLNISTPSGSSLDEAILTEKANRSVMEKSQDQGFDAIRREINNYETPLCAAY